MKIFTTPQEACIAVIEKILALQKSNKKVTIALSGGNTPKLLFSLIASNYPKSIASNVHFFWGDERMVSYDSPESNYGVFYRELVESGVISADNVHPIPYNSNYMVAKEEIEMVIREKIGAFPQFSLVILGVGEDGHVASIFPNNLESFCSRDITEIVQHPISGQTRITLTGSTINAAKEIVMLCTGSSKKEIVKEIIEKRNAALPATHVVGGAGGSSGIVRGTSVVGCSGEVDGYSGRVEWYLDCGSSPQ